LEDKQMAEKTLQTLFAGMDAFNQGLNQLATTTTISKANDAVSEIKASIENEAEQRTALQGVANELVGRLSSLGAPASQIAQVAQSVGPTPLPKSFEQAFLEGTLTGDQQLLAQAETGFESMQDIGFRQTQKETDIATKAKKDILKFKADLDKNERKTFGGIGTEGLKIVRDDLKVFNSETKELQSALQKATNTLRLAKSAKKLEGTGAGKALLGVIQRQAAKASGEQRITEEDVKALGFNPSVANSIARQASLLLGNEPLTEDAVSARKLAEVMERAAKAAISTEIEGFSKQRGPFNPIGAENLRDALFRRFPAIQKQRGKQSLKQKLELLRSGNKGQK